jgi:glycosyltransferase involved in cell wall biosynthesis
MKIVVAIPYSPWPVASGTDRLIMNLVDGLAARHEVVLVTMALGAPELARLREIERPRVTVRAIIAPHRRSALHRLWRKARNVAAAVFAGIPTRVSYTAPPELIRLIARAAREERADLVLASYWHLYRLPDVLHGPKLVLITHDLDFAVNPGRLAGMRGAARFVASIRLAALERIERKAYERYDTILTVTPSDAETLSRHPAAEGKIVRPLPLALDLAAFEACTFERERNKVLFMGVFHADFNRDALRYLLRDVWPRVTAKNPAARLEVTGQGVDGELRAAAGAGVSFAGSVEDIRPHLGSCSLMVLPLRFGGGVRIRMMEAAAMGTPVVSTPVGVAGMGLTPGAEYAEARSASDMAGAILRLLGDPAEAGILGANARHWAEVNISMESYPTRLEELLNLIVRAG